MKDHLLTLGIMLGTVSVVGIIVYLSILTNGAFFAILIVAVLVGFIYFIIYESVKEHREIEASRKRYRARVDNIHRFR